MIKAESRMPSLKAMVVASLFLIVGVPPNVYAEQRPVSIEEFNELKAEHEKLKREFEELKALVRQQKVTPSVARRATPPPSEKYVTAKEFKAFKRESKKTLPGLTNVLVTGYAFAGYTDAEGSDSNFSAGFNPLLLWELNDKLLFEAELEFELEDGSTSTKLEYAHLSYLLNDYITLGAGKFLNPFGIFRERLHPKWINKLPDFPLGYKSGATRLVPGSQIGAQVRGGVPLWAESKGNYALWVSNGPTLQTSASSAGELAFSNTNDNNNNKAFGFRVGVLPIPELEAAYSLETSRVGSSGSVFSGVDALLQGIDVSYIWDSKLLKGGVDLRSEWIWSDVDKADYGTSGGRFENKRSAWYLQLAYRPSKASVQLLKNFEPVLRFDKIDQPSFAPSNVDEERWTMGLNYWLTPSAVLKAAYQRSDKKEGSADEDTVLLQAAMGF